MADNNRIEIVEIFNSTNGAVLAGATSESLPKAGLNMNSLGVEGFFSADIVVTGTGTADVGYEVSSDGGASWVKPVTQAALTTPLKAFTSVTASSGGDTDGKVYSQLLNIATNNLIRFYITETGAANAVTVTMNLIPQ